MKGITFYKEDREPTPDNPNEIICGMVDENAEIYIRRLENKLELLQNDLDNSNSKLSDYAGRCLKAIEYVRCIEALGMANEIFNRYTYSHQDTTDIGELFSALCEEQKELLEILGDKENENNK